MNQSEIIDQIKQLLSSSAKAIVEIENNKNNSFNLALIQKNCIDSFNLADRIEYAVVKPADSIQKADHLESPLIQKVDEPAKIEAMIEELIVDAPIIETEKAVIQEITEALPAQPIAIPAQEQNIQPIEPQAELPLSVAVPPSVSKPENTKTLIASTTDDEEISINDKISKNKQAFVNFADKSSETSIPDLSKAISIGKKFEFINGLFDGNSEHYKSSIQALQNSENYQKAITFIENEITNKYDWNENEKLAAEFFALIRRRYN